MKKIYKDIDKLKEKIKEFNKQELILEEKSKAKKNLV